MRDQRARAANEAEDGSSSLFRFIEILGGASCRETAYYPSPPPPTGYAQCIHMIRLNIAGVSQVMALPMLRTLYESRFDLEMWGSGRSTWKHWQSLSDALWNKHLPYQRHPDDQWPCSAVALFGPRGIPGMRYAEVWRQVIALDCVAAFLEAGFDRQWNSSKVLMP